MKRGTYFKALTVFAIICGLLALWPVFQPRSEKATSSASLQFAKQTVLALKLYATDNENQLPERLQELTPKYIHDPANFIARYSGEKPTPFIYLPGYRFDQQPKVILIHAPKPHGRHRVAGFSDGTASIISEEEFQKLMAAQKPMTAATGKK